MNKNRKFIVDYRDKTGIYYNIELLKEVATDKKNNTNESVADSIINDFRTADFTVSIILEIINGYTAESLKILPPDDITKHLKLLYMNPEHKADYLNMKV